MGDGPVSASATTEGDNPRPSGSGQNTRSSGAEMETASGVKHVPKRSAVSAIRTNQLPGRLLAIAAAWVTVNSAMTLWFTAEVLPEVSGTAANGAIALAVLALIGPFVLLMIFFRTFISSHEGS